MDNEVTKLYKNAGVERVIPGICSNYEGDCIGCLGYIKGQKPYCTKAEYPPFTAEKQLSLIKWLGKLAGKLEISSNYNDTQYLLYFYLNRKTRDERLPNLSTGRSENFEKSLAGLINSLWQDLTESEQEQIRSILNGSN